MGSESVSRTRVFLSIFYYTVCSGLMLVANKVAVYHLPVPGMVGFAQLFFACGFIFIARALVMLRADSIDVARSKAFMPYALSFVASIYTNMRALQAANVETIIVFRSLAPLLVSILEWMWLGRELPNTRSMIALVGVALGAVGYVYTDAASSTLMSGYIWSSVYLLTIVFSMTEGKRLLSAIEFKEPVWGCVYYTNALCAPGLLLLALLAGEGPTLPTLTLTLAGTVWLAISCAIGLGVSWAGWNCRDCTSATSYTLIGVVCKLVTVLVNLMIWDKHASAVGIGWLLVCILASALYQQAPFRNAQLSEIGRTEVADKIGHAHVAVPVDDQEEGEDSEDEDSGTLAI
eukprot:NODE_5907_length_1722_cov_13.548589.p1 GENE.NODE_5907_length_1722_cov_13.548589~~NODE_5907_length_1722_cov_13.548589.p1  ORF type:complete len:347 (+),score=64.88 NODE_5907_length_1722_cov_13.548589:155-1195(+)